MNASDIPIPPGRPEILDRLRQVIDPEIQLNLVDLGMIYEVLEPSPGTLLVRMTLTAPGCPLAGPITDGVRAVLADLPDVRVVDVDLVWDPPWSPDNITPEGLQQLDSRRR